jgi:putative ABC transport system permease protein
VLFSKDFVRLVCLATIIAMPLIYFMANKWLMNYAFHTRLNWLNFLLPPLLLLVITLFTVAAQSVKTAMINPVKNLRSD